MSDIYHLPFINRMQLRITWFYEINQSSFVSFVSNTTQPSYLFLNVLTAAAASLELASRSVIIILYWRLSNISLLCFTAIKKIILPVGVGELNHY